MQMFDGDIWWRYEWDVDKQHYDMLRLSLKDGVVYPHVMPDYGHCDEQNDDREVRYFDPLCGQADFLNVGSSAWSAPAANQHFASAKSVSLARPSGPFWV